MIVERSVMILPAISSFQRVGAIVCIRYASLATYLQVHHNGAADRAGCGGDRYLRDDLLVVRKVILTHRAAGESERQPDHCHTETTTG